jgi:hypothetical protein
MSSNNSIRDNKRKVSYKKRQTTNPDVVYHGSLKPYEDPADYSRRKPIKGVILG